jgi:hypothetical protein
MWVLENISKREIIEIVEDAISRFKINKSSFMCNALLDSIILKQNQNVRIDYRRGKTAKYLIKWKDGDSSNKYYGERRKFNAFAKKNGIEIYNISNSTLPGTSWLSITDEKAVNVRLKFLETVLNDLKKEK